MPATHPGTPHHRQRGRSCEFLGHRFRLSIFSRPTSGKNNRRYCNTQARASVKVSRSALQLLFHNLVQRLALCAARLVSCLHALHASQQHDNTHHTHTHTVFL
jgi:hypothetical protein